MNVLLLGSGGREHALAVSLAASPLCDRLLIGPGNPGTARCGSNVALDVADHAAIIGLCRREQVDLVVVGPEAPLVAGLADELRDSGFRVFGPSRQAAQLEGSKAFAKELMQAEGVPTAAFATFTDLAAAKAHLFEVGAPIVVKADGLAAGKGVVVAETIEEAEAAVDAMLGGALGQSGRTVVIEERLLGEEASVFALCDGVHAIPFGAAQDHKRAFDGDRGPNTGGMGAYSPAPVVTAEVEAAVMDRIVRPTLEGMRRRGAPFVGVLFCGIMVTADGPKLIEYNVRFGDPETQAILPRLRTDLLAALVAACDGVIDEVRPSWSDFPALSVVMATKGYPGAVASGSVIRGVEQAEALDGVRVFQAGTAERGGELVASGGRVLAVTALAPTIKQAQARAYEGVRAIDWPDGFCRSDIGWRAVERDPVG